MTQTAYFAAGCFWSIEQAFRETPGVQDATSGYMGGHLPNPSYQQVCRGDSEHAETVAVEFDPDKVSFETLMQRFLTLHDPTQVDRQGPDIGRQYRSAVFAQDAQQAEAARAALAQAAPRFSRPIATEVIEDSLPFYRAEEYHQRYIEKRRRQK